MFKELSPSDQVILSFRNTFRAFDLISGSRLNWIYATPVIVYLIIFVSGFAITNDVHQLLMSHIEEWMNSTGEEGGFMGFLFSATSVITWIIIKFSVLVIFGILSGYLTLIVLSPLLTYVAERTECRLSGQKHPFRFIRFVSDVIRAVLIAVRNAGIQIFWTALLFALSFIPAINLITAPALFLITAYFYGFSFIDYYLEMKNVKMGQSIRQVRRLKWMAISLGSMFLLMNMVPWLGPFLSCLFVFHLVISATVTMHEAPDDMIETEIGKKD